MTYTAVSINAQREDVAEAHEVLKQLASQFQLRDRQFDAVQQVEREGSELTALATALAGDVVQDVEERLAGLTTLQFEVTLVPER
ncbi:hypothetical protein ACIBW9_28725 [Streptomyces sp. NPDC049541]|uniref:hypothetical protein n=1 Tax=Streptomyces sp. NPDC049541 TaxID=3365594 RepID=UPI0037A3EF46